ncbi:MAG: M20 family metallopeptidase [Patescibacteria group bacterium]|nr:M20 family metallopeptidase [Patescibacteria group bacterium]
MKKLTKDMFIKDLAKLVSFRTVTGDIEQNRKALDFIQARVAEGARIKRIKNGGYECLIASNASAREPDICYLTHVDVVAGRPSQFKMTIKDGTAFGRGVSDMKFSIPIGYALLNGLISSGSRLSFALVVTTDEETGGFKGASYLADRYGLKPKALIVPDGGDGLVFVDKAKGVCIVRVDSKGKPAHSSRIWEGKNALEPLIRLCDAVLDRYGRNNRRESWKTTANIGKLEGGVSANQVCPEACAMLDFRFSETTTFAAIFDEVSAIAKKIDPTLKVSVYSKGEPTSTDAADPTVRRFIRSFESAYRRKIKIRKTYGASDARHFSKLRVPILMIKPHGGDIHGDDENVDIDSCMLFYQALEDFLRTSGSGQKHW